MQRWKARSKHTAMTTRGVRAASLPSNHGAESRIELTTLFLLIVNPFDLMMHAAKQTTSVYATTSQPGMHLHKSWSDINVLLPRCCASASRSAGNWPEALPIPLSCLTVQCWLLSLYSMATKFLKSTNTHVASLQATLMMATFHSHLTQRHAVIASKPPALVQLSRVVCYLLLQCCVYYHAMVHNMA